MHSLYVPNIAFFHTYLSFFTANRLSCFENLAIAPITSGLRQQIKLTIKRFQKRKWHEIFSGFRTTSGSMHGANTMCFYASPSFCNLLPFFFLKAVCNKNSWHYVYTYQASRSKYLDISFYFNLPIWSGRQKNFMITSLFGKC